MKISKKILPLVFLVSCNYKVPDIDNYVKTKIPGTKYTISIKQNLDQSQLYEKLKYNKNILLTLTLEQKKSLSEVCEEADLNKDKDITNHEFLGVVGRYIGVKEGLYPG